MNNYSNTDIIHIHQINIKRTAMLRETL